MGMRNIIGKVTHGAHFGNLDISKSPAKFEGQFFHGTSMKMSYPSSSEEATKAILAALLLGPAVIQFDDMTSDWIPYSIINRMLTSGSVSERILGASRVVSPSTRTLVLGSGNNIEPLRDLRRRVITIRLNARGEVPSEIKRLGNPVKAVRENRGAYVADALTIIRAYRAAGSPKTDVAGTAGFEEWADHARHPLIWLGLPDPASRQIEQVRSDPDRDALGGLLRVWHHLFGDKPTTVRDAISSAEACGGEALEEALLELPVTDGRGRVNRSKLGWYLKKSADRVVGGLRIERSPTSARTAWRVVDTAKPPPAGAID
jgi:hypothetical protein